MYAIALVESAGYEIGYAVGTFLRTILESQYLITVLGVVAVAAVLVGLFFSGYAVERLIFRSRR